MATDRRRRLLLALLLTASWALAAQSSGPMPRVAAVGPPGNEVIQIPLRWCAIDGSTAATNPTALGEPDTDNVLWRRHERATDRIWIPGANITFRSAVTRNVLESANFPIIPDPSPSPGLPGDIKAPSINDTELMLAVAECEARWDKIALEFGTPIVGPVALNVRQLVNSSGGSADPGESPSPILEPPGSTICTDPATITRAHDGILVVRDFEFSTTPEEDAILVAHELGHVLGLRHGNGLDDDGDGPYDLYCDPGESDAAGTTSVMNKRLPDANEVITARQRADSREFAGVTDGKVIDPPAALVAGETVADRRSDSVQDVDVRSVDLRAAGLAVNTSYEVVYLSHTLFGLVGPDETNQYLLFVDLDGDPTTGGSPGKLGFATTFEGAELVTQVVVGPERAAKATVWTFDGQDLVEVTDQSIQAAIASSVTAETEVPLFDVVTVELPLSIVGQIGPLLRIQAIAEQLQPGQAFDVLPGGTPDRQSPDGVPLFIVPPEFPVCAANPAQVQPGEAVAIEATGFGRRGESVHVVLGDQLITETTNSTLDEEGNIVIEFTVPQDAREGPRLITVGVERTALTADCILQIGDVG